ncbi:MAG: membrane protein insertase YidC [Propionibacteriaceae bacterium]
MMVPMAWYSPFVSFGSAIMQPLYWVVSGLLVLFHAVWSPVFGANSGWTWTLAIISLTVVIRTALIPLFVKQIKSSRNMQMLQPKVRELQKKYGHDREKLGQETMKLYKDSGTNPFASCMPLLLQSPIFIALFRVLDGASRLDPSGNPVARGHWLKINPDLLVSLNGATIFGAKISDKLWPFGSTNVNVIIVTVVLILAMTATLFTTQLQLMRKNMPPEALEGPFAQQQKMMLYLFPVFFAVGGVNFPVGVLMYWFTSNLWTMAQQFYVIRRNPAPGTPAYAAWEARKKHKLLSVSPGADVAAVTNGSNGESTNGHRVATNGDQPTRQVPARQQPNRQQPRKQTRSQRRI